MEKNAEVKPRFFRDCACEIKNARDFPRDFHIFLGAKYFFSFYKRFHEFFLKNEEKSSKKSKN